jgi:hypothetical protein
MRRLLLVIFFLFLSTEYTFAFGAVVCAKHGSHWVCNITVNQPTPDAATQRAITTCANASANCGVPIQFNNECFGAAAGGSPSEMVFADRIPSLADTGSLVDACSRKYGTCSLLADACDGSPVDDHNTLISVVLTGLTIIVILLIYAARRLILNYLIHGNLPRILSNYGEDIEVLFTRTQRTNWYGRVVFGVVARLAMTDQQLSLVRKYWLGRVIAFDSFRRQRQNELAKMYLQFAKERVPEPVEMKFFAVLWAIFKWTFLFFFFLLRAIVSFLFGFLFIRVTIASLARGKLIESKHLDLVLEAKTAVEETASYLKVYLEVAEAFDGGEELFEPEGPINAVMEAFYGRRKAEPEGATGALRRGRSAAQVEPVVPAGRR